MPTFRNTLFYLHRQVACSIAFFSKSSQPFFLQTNGRLAMGSQLSPVIANFFMEDFEKKPIEQGEDGTDRVFRNFGI
jgi:hypothetical protein